VPIKFVCDGCAKEALGTFDKCGAPVKPDGWLQSPSQWKCAYACSFDCALRIPPEKQQDTITDECMTDEQKAGLPKDLVERACPRCSGSGIRAWHAGRCPFEGATLQ